MRGVLFVALTSAAIALVACGSSDNSKIEKIINAGLAKAPACVELPIGKNVDYAKVGADGALGILKSKGYIIESKGSEWDPFLGKRTFDSFALTDAGKGLVEKEASIFNNTCLRTGHYEIVKIEAVDIGTDAEGRPVANVRARIKFVPEEWIAGTKSMPSWSKYWKEIETNENASWLYPLLKSGSEYFSHGPGHRLK